MSLKVIAEIKGHQYFLSPNQELDVDYLAVEEGKKINLKDIGQVLALIDEENKIINDSRELKKIKVSLKVIKNFKGPKTSEFHYKAKSRYRRHKGFRQLFSRLKVEKVSYGQAKTSQVKEKK